MIAVEILLSRQVALKIGQLKYHLSEDESADEIVSSIVNDHLSSKLDLLVAQRMPREVLLEALGMSAVQPKVGAGLKTTGHNIDFDESIADLGDADEPQEGEEVQPTTQAPVKGGLTDAVLKQDMEVEDPQHEAKSDAMTMDLSSPEAFAAAVGMIPPEYVDPRVARRKRKIPMGKGKVTPMTGAIEESF